MDTQQEQVRYAQENVRITEARLRQGIVSRFDVLTAQTALSTAQQQLIAAQNQRDLAQADLSYLLGTDPDRPLTLQTPPLPAADGDAGLQADTQIALAVRPEVRQAAGNVREARRLVRLAGSTAAADGGLGGERRADDNRLHQSARRSYATVGAQVAVPLDDGGATRSRVRSARMDVQTQDLTLEQVKLNVALEVRQATLNIRNAQAQVGGGADGRRAGAGGGATGLSALSGRPGDVPGRAERPGAACARRRNNLAKRCELSFIRLRWPQLVRALGGRFAGFTGISLRKTFYVDRQTRPEQALHVRRSRAADSAGGRRQHSVMATDVFPAIDLPVVTVIWSYPGFTPNDMEKRFVTQSERAYTTSVNDIEHTESQSVSGVGVIRIYFQPGADVAQGIAQVVATSQTIQRILPPGTQPPYILRYDASDVPVIQAAVSSDTLPEQQLSDLSTNFVRTQMATVQGAQVPLPYGGRGRIINVDIDPQALYAQGLSPYDVSNAISAQNLVLPTGDAKIGTRDYNVSASTAARTPWTALNDLPIKAGQRRARHDQGRRPGARRLRDPAEHRQPERQAGGSDPDQQERQGVHAGCRQPHPGGPAAHQVHAAAGAEDQPRSPTSPCSSRPASRASSARRPSPPA